MVIKTSQHHPLEKTTEYKDGSVIYEVDVAGSDEFLRWVLGFGNEAVILEPFEMREKLIGVLKTTIDRYEKSDPKEDRLRKP
jgi:predicted DNA-binding transcriptional regulator YafY